jgi:hypothetical protein
MRVWDIREKPFKPSIEFKSGTNFATSADMWMPESGEEYLATGHRGFNGEGAEVKLWDLRNFSNESIIYEFKEH